jgi:putative ABC transport system permease protein
VIQLLQDVRYAIRQMRRAPGFTCAALVVLALGIGGTTAIFGALNPILLQPLPYAHAERIMTIWYAGVDGSRVHQTFHTYQELAERNRSFESLAVVKLWQPVLNGTDEPERLDGQRVSASYFQTLGVHPIAGRDFLSSDDVVNGPKVVILSNGLWQRRFGADRAIVGRQLKLDGDTFTVIGIMPSTFENVLAPSAQAWAPLQYDRGNIVSTETREWGHHLRLIGRVRAGLSPDVARNDLDSIAKSPVSEFPRPRWANLDHGVFVDRLQDDVTRGVRPALLAVFGAVLLVLLIACVNVTNLVLARGAQRQGELAMRLALGAARPRLARQLVTESIVLAVLGGGLAMIVAQAGIRALVILSPSQLPRLDAIRLDGTVFTFALAITIMLGIVIGLAPAWHASRHALADALQHASQRTAGSHQLTRRIFVVAEVALAMMLLVSAGLLLHSLQRLFAVSPGFDGSGVLTMQVQTYGQPYENAASSHRFFAQALDAVRQVPGVSLAGFASQLPLSGDSDIYGAHFVSDDPQSGFPVYRYSVSPGFFETLRIPLRKGRLLNDGDTVNAPPAILISESLAARRFPNQDAIGQRVRIGSSTEGPWYTVVGIVGGIKQTSLALSDSDAVYIPIDQWRWPDGALSLVVNARGSRPGVVAAVKQAIWSIDKDQPIVRIASMDDLLAASAAERRFVLVLFEAFALVALVLAGTGIYGVLSGSVTERTREIGVRAALGASTRNIVGLVLRQGIFLVAVGGVLGLAGAFAATHAITALLFGISRLDPITYLGVIIVLAIVSSVACAVPAWRAARVDPMVALRYE